jgi:MFS family permease
MVFAFVCHVASVLITIFAPKHFDPYWSLWVGNFVVALANGTVEAVVNPVVATMYTKEKTKWLNILHAGWPGGLVLGGLLTLGMGAGFHWQWKVGLLLIPTLLYGVMMLGRQFPVHERVTAGVSYKDMLREAGILGALIVVALIVRELGRVFGWSGPVQLVIGLILVGSYGAYVRSWGRPLFIFLLIVMIPLATTELGVDSWVTNLMTPVMGKYAGWVLVYTSFIMMMLRFCAGPIVHRLSPLGLLATCAAIAAGGLLALSKAEAGLAIFLAATMYGVGKTFFWPTMLGVVAERFPRGGALTLNTIGGVGMLGVGVVGAVLLGNIQDKEVDRKLAAQSDAIHAQVTGEQKMSVFGTYKPIDESRLAALTEGEKKVVTDIQATAKKSALKTVAVFPTFMFLCYVGLILYFRQTGGYRQVHLDEPAVAPSK